MLAWAMGYDQGSYFIDDHKWQVLLHHGASYVVSTVGYYTDLAAKYAVATFGQDEGSGRAFVVSGDPANPNPGQSANKNVRFWIGRRAGGNDCQSTFDTNTEMESSHYASRFRVCVSAKRHEAGCGISVPTATVSSLCDPANCSCSRPMWANWSATRWGTCGGRPWSATWLTGLRRSR